MRRLNSNGSERRRLTLVAPRFLTVRELAKYLRVHPSTVYRLGGAQQLPSLRRGYGNGASVSSRLTAGAVGRSNAAARGRGLGRKRSG